MFNAFLDRILDNPYIISINLIGIVGVSFFLILPLSAKNKAEYYLPFLLLFLVIFYENFGAYLLVEKITNQKIHEWLFNVPYQGWNIWVFNLFYAQISKLSFLSIIQNQLKGKKQKKIIQGIWIGFLFICLGLQWTGIEPLYDFQPIISGLGNVCIVFACCLFFIELITAKSYLEIDPLYLWSFWFITLTLFQSSMVFLTDVSYEYLTLFNVPLYDSLIYISQILYFLIMLSITIKFILKKLSFNPQNLTVDA